MSDLSCPFAGRDEASFEAERSFVRAPLNSRVVSGSAHRDKGKGKAKENSLYGISAEIQEALVLEDLLFVLMVCVPRFSARRNIGAAFQHGDIVHVPAAHCTRWSTLGCAALEGQTGQSWTTGLGDAGYHVRGSIRVDWTVGCNS